MSPASPKTLGVQKEENSHFLGSIGVSGHSHQDTLRSPEVVETEETGPRTGTDCKGSDGRGRHISRVFYSVYA